MGREKFPEEVIKRLKNERFCDKNAPKFKSQSEHPPDMFRQRSGPFRRGGPARDRVLPAMEARRACSGDLMAKERKGDEP